MNNDIDNEIEFIDCGFMPEPFCVISARGADGKYELSIGGENTIKVDFPFCVISLAEVLEKLVNSGGSINTIRKTMPAWAIDLVRSVRKLSSVN